MATYTDIIPSGIKQGDIVTLLTSGTYVVPSHLVAQIQVCSAPGGSGQTVVYSSGGQTATGGTGGKGCQIAFERTFSTGDVLAIETGAAGTTPSKQSLPYSFGVTIGAGYYGTSGGSGAAGKLTVNGTLMASCTGGTGGTGGSLAVGEGWAGFTSMSVTAGKAGANGAVSLKPGDATTAVSTYTTGCVVLTMLSTNAPPSNPKDITYASLYAARPVDVSWTPSVDPEGETLTYALEYRYDSGVYSTVATTTNPHATVTVPAQGSTGQFRVKAVDPKGSESGYTTGAIKPIVYNFAPTISGTDTHLGPVVHPLEYDFSVDDPDTDDVLRFAVALDGTTVMTVQNATRAQNYRIPPGVMEDIWRTLPAGIHVLTIDAFDNQGGSASRTVRFERVCNRLELETRDGVKTDELVKTVMPFFNYIAPPNATVLFQLRNDPAASWEDVTAHNANRSIFTFANEHKSTSGMARLDARAVITKGQNGGDIYFYGATLLLDANNDSTQNWANHVMIAPGDITPDGLLSQGDTNVMRALNTLSIRAGKSAYVKSITIPANAWTFNEQNSVYEATVSENAITANSNVEVRWNRDALYDVIKSARIDGYSLDGGVVLEASAAMSADISGDMVWQEAERVQ